MKHPLKQIKMGNLRKQPPNENIRDYSLEDKMKKYPTVERNKCRDCGNKWWFDQGKQGWVCTTCYKTHGKNSGEL